MMRDHWDCISLFPPIEIKFLITCKDKHSLIFKESKVCWMDYFGMSGGNEHNRLRNEIAFLCHVRHPGFMTLSDIH
jgi:hypothetical protein